MNGRINFMYDSEKINALDLVISVLREHEKTLDSLIENLESVLKNFSATSEKTKTTAAKTIEGVKYNVNILCDEWNEFREACTEAEAVSFRLDDKLSIKALQGKITYEYREPIRRHIEIMGCEVPVKFQTHLDPSELRRVLSKELNVPEKRIIQGEISFPP
jgi:hypothetical protein